MEQSIELDCPPGWPRPGDLYPEVIAGTGLVEKDPDSAFFGNWKWMHSDVDPARWLEIREITKPRIKRLYEDGKIRYGSW